METKFCHDKVKISNMKWWKLLITEKREMKKIILKLGFQKLFLSEGMTGCLISYLLLSLNSRTIWKHPKANRKKRKKRL